jgi:hypothetical protein
MKAETNPAHFKIRYECFAGGAASEPGLFAEDERNKLPVLAPTLGLFLARMRSLLKELDELLARCVLANSDGRKIAPLDLLSASAIVERLLQDSTTLEYILSHPECLEEW